MESTYDQIITAAMFSLLAVPCFLAAYGIALWLAEFVMFAVHLWRTR